MSRLAFYPNDAGVTLLDAQGLIYRQPGFALLNGENLATGDAAYAQARIDPRGIQNRYWLNLATERLGDRRFEHLSAADLVSRQIEDIWRTPELAGREVVVAVPTYLSTERLGLLLGIFAEHDVSVVAMVDAAVAATRREYQNAVPIHLDMGLHATTLTRIGQSGQALAEQSEVLDDCGLARLTETWLSTIAEAFVQQSRFDPLHAAETEQMLLDGLGDWLSQAANAERVTLELAHAGLEHSAEIDALTLVNAAAAYYQSIASRLRALLRAGEVPALQVTDRVARLPGLNDYLKARVGGEVFALEPGATARGALARTRDVESRGSAGVNLRRQLPWDQSAFAVDVAESAAHEQGTPTHVLCNSVAHAINGQPLLLGTQPGDDGRTLTLDADMPGISRSHCRLSTTAGKCVIEDSSRYGTFVNGHRIKESTVLQVGDVLRIGSPGYELQLITTDESYGA